MSLSAAAPSPAGRADWLVAHVSRHFPAWTLAACAVASVERIGEALLHDGPLSDVRSNAITQYAVNWVEHGFAKRAVVGTVLHPVLRTFDNPETAIFWLMVALTLASVVALIVLTEHALPHRDGDAFTALLRCALAVGSAGAVQVVHDYGRFDALNLLVLILGIRLVLRGRTIAAAVCVAVGILIHEGFALYGAPLVLAVGWHAMRGRGALQRLLPLGVATVLPALAVWLWGNSPSAAALDIGTGGYVWARGTFQPGAPDNWAEALGLVLCWGAVLVLVGHVFRGGHRLREPLFWAALAPIALCLFGIDLGRWLTLTFFGLVISVAVQRQALGRDWPPPGRAVRIAGYLMCLPLGSHGVTGVWTWWL